MAKRTNCTTMEARRDARGGTYTAERTEPGYGGIDRPAMTREQAQERFRKLVARYGLNWTTAPAGAYVELAAINTLLDERGRREALGLQT